MRIGILVPSIGAFGQKGFYNAQEIGLAKALDKLCDEIVVYRLTDFRNETKSEPIEGCKNAAYHLLPAKRIGSNGLPDLKQLDASLDVLIFFSDTQLCVPQVHRWAERNDIVLIPYIGVAESHSGNRMKKLAMDLLFRRNVAVYKKHRCAAKTPAVKAELMEMGISDVTVAPIGLDLSLLNADYLAADAGVLKQKYGYSSEDRVLLFIGRMTEEKQPLQMVRLFAQLYGRDPSYRLFMVGTGELCEQVSSEVERLGLSDCVQMRDRIPNRDIWELYRIADCFVNLNRQEIFGMAILEAMYYGCKVVAWEAPGPSFIIEDGMSGCLADSDEEMIDKVFGCSISAEEACRRVKNHFTWTRTADIVLCLCVRDCCIRY